MDSRTRLALIFSARTASWAAIPAIMAEPPPPTATSESSSAFMAAPVFPALGLGTSGPLIGPALLKRPFGLEPQNKTEHFRVLSLSYPLYFDAFSLCHRSMHLLSVQLLHAVLLVSFVRLLF